MIDKQSKDYQLGIEYYKQGLSYNDKLVSNSNILSGWTDCERDSKCGYIWKHWNKTGNYKTSADLSTLF